MFHCDNPLSLCTTLTMKEGCKQIIPIGREDDDEPSALVWTIHFSWKKWDS